MFSRIRVSTSTLRNRWHSRRDGWSHTPRLASTESKEVLEHGNRVYHQVITETELGAFPYNVTDVSMTYPQKVRLSDADDSDGTVYVIQGGNYTEGTIGVHSVV